MSEFWARCQVGVEASIPISSTIVLRIHHISMAMVCGEELIKTRKVCVQDTRFRVPVL